MKPDPGLLRPATARDAFPARSGEPHPSVLIIGDSTVKNGQGDGAGGFWGWGDPLGQFFDNARAELRNYARGGTSSRTYRTLGLWEPVRAKLKAGDFALMQFGHNDEGAINDDARARGTLDGTADDFVEIDNILTGERETVHSYGWYITQYIREIKNLGATAVVISPIPRNDWNAGKVIRNRRPYGLWARQVAENEGVLFIDLHEKMAAAMEKSGEEKVTGTMFFKHDHTHTSARGAVLAASLIVEGIRQNPEYRLNRYLLANPEIEFPAKT
jgi:lysophospholipase L1-like esterase